MIEADKDQRNLFGTDTLEKQQKEYIDQYLESRLYQQQDFEILNAELWDFIFKRYGGNPVLRFYSSNLNTYYTTVETKLLAMKVQYLNSKKLADKSYTAGMFKGFWS